MSPRPEPQSEQTAQDGLTVKLPQAITVTEFTVTHADLGRVLDAATRLYVRSRPTDDASITLHLAMKTAARALLWFMAKKPQAGWTQVPRLTRHDDASAVVIRYMLENFFGEAIRHSGGVIDATTAPKALAAPDSTTQQGDYGELVTALAGLVSGQDAGEPSDAVSPLSRPAQGPTDQPEPAASTTTARAAVA